MGNKAVEGKTKDLYLSHKCTSCGYVEEISFEDLEINLISLDNAGKFFICSKCKGDTFLQDTFKVKSKRC